MHPRGHEWHDDILMGVSMHTDAAARVNPPSRHPKVFVLELHFAVGFNRHGVDSNPLLALPTWVVLRSA